MRYEEVEPSNLTELRRALARGDMRTAAKVIVGVSLHGTDMAEGVTACIEAARVDDEVVRGNAILGFSHLARRFRQLDRVLVEPLIAAALKDESEYVRGQAQSAADDVELFLGWQVSE